MPSGWDLPLVCVINPIRCMMSLALEEPRNEGLYPKQWILFYKETIYISFLLKNQRKIFKVLHMLQNSISSPIGT